MSTRDDIEHLDAKLSKLKVEYEQYFMRLIKREPVKLRAEVEKIILVYSNKSISNTSMKFRYNSLVAKYNSYKQYWGRTLRAIEEGTFWRRAEGEGGRVKPVRERPTPERSAPEPAPAGAGAGGGDEVKAVYEKYIEARRACNEPTDGVTYEKLASTIERYKRQAEERYNVKDVDLKVYVKDGKAKLAITPKKGR
ncbi:MAG: MXAN_5187 C-terminal domain-containing protein [Thermodesulfobacteriota bacterium]